jgi:presenilin-like A22 family membrane protease
VKKAIAPTIRIILSAGISALIGVQTESWALVLLCLIVSVAIEKQVSINARQERINLAQLNCAKVVKRLLRP